MNRNLLRDARAGVGFAAALLVATLLASACKGAGESDRIAMLVTYASADAVIQRGASELPAKVGLAINMDDVIRTNAGPVDLQTQSGATVRVRPFSVASVRSLTAKDGVGLDLRSGGLSARVRRAASDEQFIVTTPTAIAGVRGTTFTVEEDAQKGAVVTVIDGKVAVAPRSAELSAAAGANAELQSLASALEAQEQVVEAGQAASLNPATVATVREIDRTLAAARSENAPLPAQAAAEIKADLAAQPGVTVAAAEITLRETTERETLIAVDEKAFEAALANPSPETVLNLTDSYRAERAQAIETVAGQAATLNVNSEADLNRLYDLIEVVQLKNGNRISGAVMTQAGDVIVVHSALGVRTIPIADINFIDYVESR